MAVDKAKDGVLRAFEKRQKIYEIDEYKELVKENTGPVKRFSPMEIAEYEQRLNGNTTINSNDVLKYFLGF